MDGSEGVFKRRYWKSWKESDGEVEVLNASEEVDEDCEMCG
jgi:hypothetical protein